MAKFNEKQAKLKSSNNLVTVYRHRERGTWIDSSDLITEYQPEELIFEE